MEDKKNIYLILENIRSVHNVASIFRTASTCAVVEILCVGTTPTPIDAYGNKRKDFTKVALGAEDMVPWRHAQTFEEAKEIYPIPFIAVEQIDNAVPYHTYTYPSTYALVFGAEVEGLSNETCSHCIVAVVIPMIHGGKESLNVAVACGVVLYRSLYA